MRESVYLGFFKKKNIFFIMKICINFDNFHVNIIIFSCLIFSLCSKYTKISNNINLKYVDFITDFYVVFVLA